MPDSNVTVDYEGERPVPPPISKALQQFLRRSFSIADLLRRALRGWLLAILGLVVGFGVGVNAIATSRPLYNVSIGVIPTESNGSDLGETAGALGALAGLVGLQSGPVPKFTRFVSALYATGVAEIMDRRHDMVCRTFSNCDLKTHTWRKSTGYDAWRDRTLARLAHMADPDSPRTSYDLAQYTKGHVSFSTDKNTRILTLSTETREPDFMKMYLTLLVQSANDYIKEQDRDVIQQYVNYLYGKLATNTNITQRDALSTLLLEQERRLMLTAVDVPYAAVIQDKPSVSDANNPSKTLMVDSVIGAILGGMLGIVLSFIPKGSAWRRPLWRRR